MHILYLDQVPWLKHNLPLIHESLSHFVFSHSYFIHRSSGVITGAVIGSIAGLLGLIALIVFFCCIRRRRQATAGRVVQTAGNNMTVMWTNTGLCRIHFTVGQRWLKQFASQNSRNAECTPPPLIKINPTTYKPKIRHLQTYFNYL